MKPVFTVILGTIAHAAVANAQPASAQAEILFRQGKELMVKGQISDACAAFDASQKLDPSTSTVLNQANCREKNQQYATAWGLYLDAERVTRTASDGSGQQLHELASAGVTRLEPKLSTLTIAVSEDAKVLGLEVVRDQDVVDPGAWNKALPIDGGTYRITARAPGNAEWTSTVSVGSERDAKTIDIPRLKSAASDKPKPTPESPPVVAAAPEAADKTNKDLYVVADNDDAASSRSRWLPYAIGGAGALLLGGALAAELVAESTYDDAKANLVVARQLSLWHRANNERYLAEGCLAGGVIAAGLATWLYLRDRRSERSITVAGNVGSGHAALQLQGAF